MRIILVLVVSMTSWVIFLFPGFLGAEEAHCSRNDKRQQVEIWVPAFSSSRKLKTIPPEPDAFEGRVLFIDFSEANKVFACANHRPEKVLALSYDDGRKKIKIYFDKEVSNEKQCPLSGFYSYEHVLGENEKWMEIYARPMSQLKAKTLEKYCAVTGNGLK